MSNDPERALFEAWAGARGEYLLCNNGRYYDKRHGVSFSCLESASRDCAERSRGEGKEMSLQIKSVEPKHILMGLGIVGITIVLSSMFHAMSVQTLPSTEAQPDPVMVITDKINKCVEDGYGQINASVDTDKQAQIRKSCTDTMLAAARATLTSTPDSGPIYP